MKANQALVKFTWGYPGDADVVKALIDGTLDDLMEWMVNEGVIDPSVEIEYSWIIP